MWGYVASVGNLFRRPSVGNSGAAGERVITESRLPVPGDDELGAIQKTGAVQKRSGKIDAIQRSLEEVRALDVGS